MYLLNSTCLPSGSSCVLACSLTLSWFDSNPSHYRQYSLLCTVCRHFYINIHFCMSNIVKCLFYSNFQLFFFLFYLPVNGCVLREADIKTSVTSSDTLSFSGSSTRWCCSVSPDSLLFLCCGGGSLLSFCLRCSVCVYFTCCCLLSCP